MAKIFLDANYFIDITERNKDIDPKIFSNHILFISPLSLHILLYVSKRKMPDSKMSKLIELFSLVPFNNQISQKALSGPTSDFEDNVQLHSAIEMDCNYFLTEDRKIFTLGFFGKMQIIDRVALLGLK